MSRVDTFDATRAAELPVAFEVYSANFCLYRMTVTDRSEADPHQ
jgi:hypothetical protein